jgi:hypothetical protein
MKIHQLKRRLQKLECALRCEPDEFTDNIFALLWFAVAYYMGNPSRHEKPFAAYARALGYASESEFNLALDVNDLKLLERFVAAEAKLYAKFGRDPKTSDGNKIREALLNMRAGLPESYKDQAEMVVKRTKISLEWMRNQSGDIAAYIRLFA